MIKAELEKVERKFAQGIDLIESGKIEKARKIGRSLRSSWAASEASRAEFILEGLCLLHENKFEEARQFCLDRMSCLWTDPYALYVLRAPYDPPATTASWFDVEIAAAFGGGNAKDYRCRLLVLAESDFEAVRYIEEIFTAEGFEMDSVIAVESESAVLEEGLDQKGVYASTAFHYRESPEPFLQQSAAGKTKELAPAVD